MSSRIANATQRNPVLTNTKKKSIYKANILAIIINTEKKNKVGLVVFILKN